LDRCLLGFENNRARRVRVESPLSRVTLADWNPQKN